ncbi:MAG: hypothetical protein WC503_00865 [Candidatus Shapirobacteria bacterium]
MNQKTKNIIKGILLIAVPLIIIIVIGYYYVQNTFNSTMSPITKGFGGITINNPPVGLFDSLAQILIGLGICLSSVCWGVAKVIKALRT